VPAVLLNPNVVQIGERVPSLAHNLAVALVAVLHVVGVSPLTKMLRTHARRSVAGVKHMQTRVEVIERECRDKAVRRHRPIVYLDEAVPIAIFACGPEPALS
jgi:hypothetical protein